MQETQLAITELGSTGLEITRVGFGAWAIGGGGWEFGWGPVRPALGYGNQDVVAVFDVLAHLAGRERAAA